MWLTFPRGWLLSCGNVGVVTVCTRGVVGVEIRGRTTSSAENHDSRWLILIKARVGIEIVGRRELSGYGTSLLDMSINDVDVQDDIGSYGSLPKVTISWVTISCNNKHCYLRYTPNPGRCLMHLNARIPQTQRFGPFCKLLLELLDQWKLRNLIECWL